MMNMFPWERRIGLGLVDEGDDSAKLEGDCGNDGDGRRSWREM